VPAIYANTGLKTPSALLELPQPTPPVQLIGDPFTENLAPIAEGRTAAEHGEVSEKTENHWSLLPHSSFFSISSLLSTQPAMIKFS